MTSIQDFLAGKRFAVAGASADRSKYGNKILRALIASGRTTYPLNPHAAEVEGVVAYKSIGDLPETIDSLSIVTPPSVTLEVVRQAIVSGVKHLWMQPGAENPLASQLARDAGLDVIDDGSCILVLLARY